VSALVSAMSSLALEYAGKSNVRELAIQEDNCIRPIKPVSPVSRDDTVVEYMNT
jgi:hypothetical protein